MDVPRGMCMPVLKALQGHPQAGWIFDELVERKYVKPLKEKVSVVEPSIMTHTCPQDKSRGITVRQVYDFLVAASTSAYHEWVQGCLDSSFDEVKHDGIMEMYMGSNVHQTRYYI